MKTNKTDRPIIFSGPMIRAILDGKKTQTRRIMKPQPIGDETIPVSEIKIAARAKFKPGGRLWVREKFATMHGERFYAADQNPKQAVLFWRPSIHMSRHLCRIWLEIVSVRFERVQEISNADCVAEAIEPLGPELAGRIQAGKFENRYSIVRQLYSEIWDTLHGANSWVANPWVWVVEFRRIKPSLEDNK
jgi:hypothetical protein